MASEQDTEVGTQWEAASVWPPHTFATEGDPSFLDVKESSAGSPDMWDYPDYVPDVAEGSLKDAQSAARNVKVSKLVLLKGRMLGALLLLAAVIGAGHLYRRLRPLPAKPLILDAEHMDQYERDFGLSAEKLQRTLAESSETVKDAFLARFAPTWYGVRLAPDAAALFEQHISSFREIPRPAETADEGEQLVYALRLRLMTSIFTSAAIRLSSLQDLEEHGKSHPDCPIPVLRLRGEILDRHRVNKEEGTVSFPAFAAMLGGRRVDLVYQKQAAGQLIPESLARRLVSVLQADDMLDRSDRQVHNIFRELLQAVPEGPLPVSEGGGTDIGRLPIPPGNKVFPLDLFRRVLCRAEELREQQYISASDAASWAKEWNTKGVIKVVSKLEDLAISREVKASKAVMHAQKLWTEEGDPNTAGEREEIHPGSNVFALAVSLL